MTPVTTSFACARARAVLVGAVALALLGGCNSDKTLTTPAARTPTDSLAATFPPLVGQIAFVSTRDGSPYIYVAAADGSSLRRLTKGLWPEWSPDGRQIVFNGADSSGDPSIHIINADGSGERVLQITGSSPNVSPDGRRLSFSNALGLYVANADGSNPTLLVSSDWQAPGYRVTGAGWSPDGTRIAFVSGGAWWDDGVAPSVYVANVDGSRIAGTAQPAYNPRWSPDGSVIAFTTVDYPYFGGNGPHQPDPPKAAVGLAAPDGSSLRLHDVSGAVADWSPDGRVLMVVRSTPLGDRIFVTDTSFQTIKRLVPEAVAPSLRSYADDGAVWSRQ